MSSSFFDKAKDVAQQAIDEARRGLDEGQTKLDELATKKQTEKLLVALGAASYAQHRGSGTPQAVEQALTDLDEHVAQNGLVGFPDAAVMPPPSDLSRKPPTG